MLYVFIIYIQLYLLIIVKETLENVYIMDIHKYRIIE